MKMPKFEFCLIFVLCFFTADAAVTQTLKNWDGVGPHSFDYLLGEDSYTDTDASVIFVDYEVDASLIREYQQEGKTVICYINVGAWEEWRPDAGSFPESVLGNDYDGWPGERWLDIRQLDVLMPIMRRRYELAASKRCQGVDPDNMNGYQQDSGFDLSFDDQLNFNLAVTEEAKRLGMLAGLKNTHEQTWELVEACDFAVVEQCVAYEECEPFSAFIENDKPVFVIEYTDSWDEDDFWDQVCPLTEETQMSYILKDYDLHNDFIASCL